MIGNTLSDTTEYTAEKTTFPVTAYAEEIKPVVEELKEVEIKIDTEEYNCYLYVKNRIPRLPRTNELKANSIYPNVGGVTILNYNELIHYVINEKVEEKGIWINETNFGGPGYSKRFLTWEYLKGKEAKYWNQND